MAQDWKEADTTTSVVERPELDGIHTPRSCIVHVSERVSNATTRILDRSEITIGRGSSCSLHIPCGHISRVHAKIVREGDEWRIRDNSSVNGILINGVKTDTAVLQYGDRIDLGRGEALLFRPYDSDYQRAIEAQRLESLGRLASGIAHDFNNVLMAIVGAAGCLAEEVGSGNVTNVEATTQDIMTASERGADLARQLLSFARRGEQANTLIEAGGVAAEVQRLLRRTFDQRVRVESNLKSQAMVVADYGQLVQVLMNLCINSRDAMPAGGILTIEVLDEHPPETDSHGQFVCIRVTDTGQGMTPEIRQRVFEPFFSTKGEGHGTGLGLSTSYGIVKNYGGIIDIQSQPGLGTSVSVYLPSQGAATRQDGDSSSSAPALDSVTQQITARGAGRHILLAEDQPLVRRHTSRLLKRLGYEVIEAHDGVEAVELLANAEVPICLAMLDLQMPRRSGDEAFRMMREIDADLPVVMVSGNIEDPRIEALVASSGVEVLAKPYAASELARVLIYAR